MVQGGGWWTHPATLIGSALAFVLVGLSLSSRPVLLEARHDASELVRQWPVLPPQWPWEEDREGWVQAARVNRKLERKRREGDSVIYFLHVSKAGGTTLCKRASMHGEVTTTQGGSGPARGLHCNFASSKHKGLDERINGNKAEQEDFHAEIREVCNSESGCGLTFVGNERQLAKPGHFLSATDRPWIYVTSVRDPLDLVLSNFIMISDDRWGKISHPSIGDLLNYLPRVSRGGHLVSLFAGYMPSKGNITMGPDPSLVNADIMEERYAEAIDRLKHFSVVMEMSLFERSYQVLLDRMGWAPDESMDNVILNARDSACMRCEPAFQNSAELRKQLFTIWHVDLRFHSVCAALAEKMIAEVTPA